jgi:phage terminase Nu1 subunit (DNA packaging protein)
MSSRETCTIEELAALMRVAVATVQAWIKAGMPVARQGKAGGGKVRSKTLLQLRSAVSWYFAENFERAELERAKTRLASAQAQRTEQEMALRAGDVIDAEVALAWIEDMALTVKSRLAQIPDAVANQVDIRQSPAVAAAVRKLIDEALAELAGGGRSGAARELGKVGAAAHVNGKRVGRSQSAPLERGKRRARAMAN